MNRIQELEEQISLLPIGYISKKKIQGKTRYYRQWVENGKIKSKYIPEEQYEEISSQIAKRKELESELKKLKKNVPVCENELKQLSFEMNVISGSTLKNLSNLTTEFKERDCCQEIRTYLSGKITPRVCVVYGLRRTGKTTMILQVLSKMVEEQFNKSVYIKARKGQTMNMLDRDMKKLYDNGYRFVFIDEATLIDDFIDTASFLSDIYAALGMKIVLSGTDSLGLWFANKEELYDRTYMIHTTWISYAEHSKLLGISDIDDYIRFGGTLRVGETDFDDPELKNEEVSFRDDETTRRYIDTAICQNIQHSLKCYEGGEHFRNLRTLYDNNDLTGAINRVIESMNHRFLLEVLTRDFKSNDLALAKKNLLREKNIELRTDVLDRVNLEEITKKLMDILQIRNADMMKTSINENHVKEIKDYLRALELIDTCPKLFIGGTNYIEDQTIITQPGMRYCQAQALVHSLMKDSYFDEMSTSMKTYVTNKILDEVKGRMMEEIIQFETIKTKMNCDVFKLVFDVGEFDMIVYDRITNSCRVYEIKHSTECSKEQTKHLCDEEKCLLTQRRFGKIEAKYVIYRGETTEANNGIKYINASEYLLTLKQNF